MKKIALLTAALLLSGCSSGVWMDMTTPDKAAAAAAVLDLGTTAIGGYNGCQEANPLFGSEIDTQALLTGAALSAGVGYAIHRWGKDKFTWGYVGLRGAAGLHNLTVIGDCQP